MKRKITFLIATLFALTLTTQSFTAVGQTKTDPTYKLTAVTSVSAGNKYVFVRDGHALINSVSSSALQTASSYSTTGLGGTESYVWTLESATGGFYMKNVSLNSSQYLNNSSSTSVSFGNKSSIWSIAFTNGVALISNTSNSNRFLGDAGKDKPNHTYKAYATQNTSDYQHDFTVYILEEESDDPSITVAPSSLTGLSYNHGNGPSTAKSFTVSGTNLSANINITAPTHYEICTTSNGTYSGSLSLTPSTGTVSNTTIYARLKAGQNVGDYNTENVTLNSTGATQKTVSLSGTVSGYTVTYDCNDGTSNCPDNENNVPSGSYTINSTEPSRTNYSFGGWNDGTTTYDAGDEYTITGNVTFTAQWVPDTYAYAIDITGPDTGATATLSVGGETLDEDDEIDYDAEVTINVNVSIGYGYSIEVLDSEDNEVEVDDDNKFTMPASEVYITITTEVNPYLQAKLTSSNMENMTSNGTGYGNLKYTTVNGFYWESNGQQATKPSSTDVYGMIQLRDRTKAENSYIKLPVFNGKIESVVLTVTNASATSSSGDVCKAIFNFQTNNAYNGEYIIQGGNSSSGTNEVTLDLSETFCNTGYIKINNSSNAARIWNITVTYLPYDNFTDLDPSDPMPASLSAGANVAVPSDSDMSTTSLTIPATAALVVKSGATLTLSGTLTNQGTAANLIIEDGGQLITNNSVKATIVRDITSASSKTVDDHWYTIASSVNAPTFASVTNLTTDGTYDLYRYDEASFTWQNSKKDIGGGVQQFTAFQNGRGYLYRKAGSEKIKYEGDVNVGNLTYTLMSYASENASVKGFNLIGNPFPHNIYKGYGGAIDESKLSDKFYYLDDNSTWQIGTYETPIKPGMGIMVQTNSTGDITIKDDNTAATAEKAPAAKSSVNEMMFTIANSQYKDAVYAVFDDGYGLYKLEHQNTEAPMAYITQNNKRYGSAMMSDDVRSFNLNFKAKTISQYTLSCKAFGEFDYVHVIDRLTGEDIDMLLEGEYNFVAAPEDMENRFIVKLGSNADNNENEVFVFQNGNDIVVNGEGELQIFDVTGRMISTQHVSGVETVSRPSQTGVYIFRIVGETVKTQKIVVE